MSNTIVSSVTNTSPTGFSQQTHTIYAVNSARWWHFYWASSTSIASVYSSDGVTWTAGASLTATSGSNNGCDISVLYHQFSTTDVVYLIYGETSSQTAVTTRGTISGTTLTWGGTGDTSNGANSTETAPYGYTVVLDSGGHPWASIANADDFGVMTEASADTGGAFTPSFGASTAVIATNVTNNAKPRPIWALGASNKLLVATGDDATANSADNQIYYNTYNGSAWGTEASIGFTSHSESYNDWNICRLSDTDFHAVRRNGTGFEHRRWNGTSWSAGNTLPSGTSSAATEGLGLVSDGTSVWLVIIDSAASNNVKYSKWTSAGGWAAWVTLESTSATRQNLGVSPMVDATGNKNFLVYWQEGTASPWAIKGSLLATVTATPSGWDPDLWPPRATVATHKPATAPVHAAYRTVTPRGYTFPIVSAPSGTTTNFSTTVEGVSVSDSLTMVATGAQTDPTLVTSDVAGGTATSTLTEIALSTAESQSGTGGLGPSDSLASVDSFTFAAGTAASDQATVTDVAGGSAAKAITEIALSTAESQGGTGGLGPSDSLAAADTLAEVGTDSLPADSVTVSDSVVLASGGGTFNAVAEGVTVSDSFTLVGTSAISEVASLNDVGGGNGTVTFGADSLAASDSVVLTSGGQASLQATDTLSTSDSYTFVASGAQTDPTLTTSDTLGGTSSLSFAEVLAEAEAILFQWGAHLTADTLTPGAETLTGIGTWAPVDTVTPLDTPGLSAVEVLGIDSVAVLDSIVAASVIPSNLQNAALLLVTGTGTGLTVSSEVGANTKVLNNVGNLRIVAGPLIGS